MSTRAAGSRPSSLIQGPIAAQDPSKTAVANESCSSRSDSTMCLRDAVGLGCLRSEYVQSRNVGIPFDQCRDLPEPLQRVLVQCPHRFANLRSVRVDPDFTRSHAIDGMARKVDLL